ncbi:SUKH-4 family immunity protein [Actinomadura sp. KC06]|uniref:SUKH-4 family immunity protein n=1 Tax=Actinomadura sp. KC06 TaxID=2530369 RepID=UPI0014052BFE|nr:SUKH-4 family immunity protein [Actinomadura sp. KC06]
MPSDELPAPPAFEAVISWAGAGRVVRAAESDVATWRLPKPQKAALVSCGIPLIADLVDAVSFNAEPTTYRLARVGDESSDLGWEYAAVPESGKVLQAVSSDGSTKFVNSTINHWLRSLHLVGSHLAASTALSHWDEDDQAEEEALAELADLLDQIRKLDPPAFADGNHQTHFWPATLDRWLY